MTWLAISEIFKQGEKGLVLKNISFSQQRFQKIALAGETGSGKSTLLKIIAGLVQSDSGGVKFEGEIVEGPEQKLVPGHPSIAYLSQHFELPRFLSVEQILSYANAMTDKHANSIYHICKIDHLLERNTDQLSGGEKQRIALARILISSPKLLLLDEPFSNLDHIHKNILKSVINEICKKIKITCILVSHDPGDILSWADQILVMQHGQIVQQGPPEVLYKQPFNEYVAGLLGKYSLLKYQQVKLFFTKTLASVEKRNMLIRPEHFKFVTKGRRSLKGKVTNISFFGSYYEVEVLILENSITVRTDKVKNVIGETVYVSVLPGNVWYV